MSDTARDGVENPSGEDMGEGLLNFSTLHEYRGDEAHAPQPARARNLEKEGRIRKLIQKWVTRRGA